MPTLRIHDLERGALTFDLSDLLLLLKPSSMKATWMVSSVKSSDPSQTWFEAVGDGAEQLEGLADTGVRISGAELAILAANTRQVIWGQFTAFLADRDEWVTVRAIDSTFYEITTSDKTVLNAIEAAFDDAREVEAPWTDRFGTSSS